MEQCLGGGRVDNAPDISRRGHWLTYTPGLFVGSGSALASGGPVALWIGYCLMATMVYAMMVALGEMATLFPVAGAFTHYASRFVDESLGFVSTDSFETRSFRGDLNCSPQWEPIYNGLPARQSRLGGYSSTKVLLFLRTGSTFIRIRCQILRCRYPSVCNTTKGVRRSWTMGLSHRYMEGGVKRLCQWQCQ